METVKAKRRTAPEIREETVLPPQDSTLIKDAEAFLAAHARGAALLADGRQIDLPDEVFDVLERVVSTMARGEAVTVAPVSLQLTTSQAADVLGISRQTLVRLLDEKALPYEQPRRHRLLRLEDVLEYKRRRHAERRMALAEMTRQAGEDELYDDTNDMYSEALAMARKNEV